MNLSIRQQNNGFVIIDNNQPLIFPDILNRFKSMEDAKRMVDIIVAQSYVGNILRGYGL